MQFYTAPCRAPDNLVTNTLIGFKNTKILEECLSECLRPETKESVDDDKIALVDLCLDDLMYYASLLRMPVAIVLEKKEDDVLVLHYAKVKEMRYFIPKKL